MAKLRVISLYLWRPGAEGRDARGRLAPRAPDLFRLENKAKTVLEGFSCSSLVFPDKKRDTGNVASGQAAIERNILRDDPHR